MARTTYKQRNDKLAHRKVMSHSNAFPDPQTLDEHNRRDMESLQEEVVQLFRGVVVVPAQCCDHDMIDKSAPSRNTQNWQDCSSSGISIHERLDVVADGDTVRVSEVHMLDRVDLD